MKKLEKAVSLVAKQFVKVIGKYHNQNQFERLEHVYKTKKEAFNEVAKDRVINSPESDSLNQVVGGYMHGFSYNCKIRPIKFLDRKNSKKVLEHKTYVIEITF